MFQSCSLVKIDPRVYYVVTLGPTFQQRVNRDRGLSLIKLEMNQLHQVSSRSSAIRNFSLYGMQNIHTSQRTCS